MNRKLPLHIASFLIFSTFVSLVSPWSGTFDIQVQAQSTTESTQNVAQEDETDAEAQNPGESASPSATTQKLRERIEKIVEEKKDQIKNVLSEFDQKKRGTLGNVTRVSEESITIKTRKATEIISINEEVTLLKAGRTIAIADVAVDDWAVVMGVIEDDTFQARRILISSTNLRPPTPVVTLGTLEEITRNQITINPRNQEESIEITINAKTTYQDITGEEIASSDLSADMQAIVAGYEDDKNEKFATVVRVLTVISEE